jgi:hypothetical protein
VLDISPAELAVFSSEELLCFLNPACSVSGNWQLSEEEQGRQIDPPAPHGRRHGCIHLNKLPTPFFLPCIYIYDDMTEPFSQQMNDVLNTPFRHFCLELEKHAVTQQTTSHFINNGSQKALR